MKQNQLTTPLLTIVIILLNIAVLFPIGNESKVLSQQSQNQVLPAGLNYVPGDAALFAYVDVSKIWESPILKSIRKADAKSFEDFNTLVSTETGLKPEDLQSAVLFIPRSKNLAEAERVGLVLNFRRVYNKEKLEKAALKLLPGNTKISLVPVAERTALFLVNLGDEYAKPQAVAETDPLAAALKTAAAGKHAVVVGSTLTSLPEVIRRDDLPVEVRPFQPLLRSSTITAAVDVGSTIDLDVRVKTESAAQAIECEKSLGLLLELIQNQIGEGTKVLEADTATMGMKDVVAIMKAATASAKNAKFKTTGTEVKLTASISADLPFASAFVAAKKKVQDAAGAATSANNLKQIAIAMHNYHDTYGAFPPAAVCGKKGNPQLSWRVLILPFIEQENLFKEFKLDEPWDSAHNKKLLAKMPKTYALPGKSKDGDTETYYRVFVGNGAGFDWVNGNKITSITDGTSQTIMCVTAASSVPWTKPDELDFDPDKDMTKLLGASINGKVQYAMFDGSVHAFGKIPDKKTLNALITRAGGEVIPELP